MPGSTPNSTPIKSSKSSAIIDPTVSTNDSQSSVKAKATQLNLLACQIAIPELSRTLTLERNVDLILHCGAYYRDESFHTWHPFALTRALENQIYFLSLNRAGEHYGNSLFCLPWMDENRLPQKFPAHAECFKHFNLQKSISGRHENNTHFYRIVCQTTNCKHHTFSTNRLAATIHPKISHFIAPSN